MTERVEQTESRIQTPAPRIAVQFDANVPSQTQKSSASAESILPPLTITGDQKGFGATISPNVRFGHGTQVDWVPPTGMQVNMKPDVDGKVNHIMPRGTHPSEKPSALSIQNLPRDPSGLRRTPDNLPGPMEPNNRLPVIKRPADTDNRAPGSLQRPIDADKRIPGNWQKPPFDTDKKTPRDWQKPPFDTDNKAPRARQFDTDKKTPRNWQSPLIDSENRAQGQQRFDSDKRNPSNSPNRDGAAPNRDKPRFDTDKKPADGMTLEQMLTNRARLAMEQAKRGISADQLQELYPNIRHGNDGKPYQENPDQKGNENNGYEKGNGHQSQDIKGHDPYAKEIADRDGEPDADDVLHDGSTSKDVRSAALAQIGDPNILARATADQNNDHLANYLNEDKAAREAKAVAAAARQEKQIVNRPNTFAEKDEYTQDDLRRLYDFMKI